MSVIRFELQNAGREGSFDWRFNRKHTLTYKVYTDDIADGDFVVNTFMAEVFPPVYILGNDIDERCYLESFTSKATQNDNVWVTTAQYNSKLDYPESGNGGGPPNTLSQDPTARPPIIKYKHRAEKIAVMEDQDGFPIVNSAGSPFNPPQMVEVQITTIMITINRLFDAPEFFDAINNVNIAPYELRGRTYPAGMLKIKSIDFDPEFDQFQIYKWCYEIDVAPKVWPWNSDWTQTKILNAGCWQLNGDNVQVVCHDVSGAPSTTAVPLDILGHQIPSPNESNIVYATFRLYDQIDFTSIGL